MILPVRPPDVNDCGSQCQHGGTCVDMVEGFYCSCRPGYTGHVCELEVNECGSNPCQNGAICEDRLYGYNCLCPNGFSGVHCEVGVYSYNILK